MKSKRKQITFTISPEGFEKISEIAKTEGFTKASYVRYLIFQKIKDLKINDKNATITNA